MNTIDQSMPMEQAKVIGKEQLKRFNKILKEYKAGKARTEQRIIASEQWWKLRNTAEEQKVTEVGKDGGYTSVSGWLHNVITSKHADSMESFPEPNILPRESGDKQEARMLSAIIPCILEQNGFEKTYSDEQWQKLKGGTGCYKVIWDQDALNGLGDICVENVNLLNLFWEPGKHDIQKSRYMFQVELRDREALVQQYPQLEGKLKNSAGILTSRFVYDDSINTSGMVPVVDVYYKKYRDGVSVLHYCKYVGEEVLYATENDTEPDMDMMTGMVKKPPIAETGLYDHGLYPYVFDALFPIEGSPCGYSYIDLGKNPQTEIDVLKTAFLKNSMAGAIPRYFSQQNGNVSEREMLDLSNPIVHVDGPVDEVSLRRIEHNSLDGNYVNVLNMNINELRETTGNTETANGAAPSGVTAASAIAALQEASGKGSRDSTLTSYRAYSDVVWLCIELVRQFYDLPRKFRITGENGSMMFTEYTNQGIVPQQQFGLNGEDMGVRKPVFDIKVSAQRKNVYTKVSNNEMALQFFQMGFFNPQLANQALICLEIMDFDGKDEVMQKISQQNMLMQRFMYWLQMAMGMAVTIGDMRTAQAAQQDMMMFGGGMGGMMPMQSAAGTKQMAADNVSGAPDSEPTIVKNARERSLNASKPEG